MSDLFGMPAGDPVMDAKQLLLAHGFVAIPTPLLDRCLSVFAVLASDAESQEEADEIEQLIGFINAQMRVFDHG